MISRVIKGCNVVSGTTNYGKRQYFLFYSFKTNYQTCGLIDERLCLSLSNFLPLYLEENYHFPVFYIIHHSFDKRPSAIACQLFMSIIWSKKVEFEKVNKNRNMSIVALQRGPSILIEY